MRFSRVFTEAGLLLIVALLTLAVAGLTVPLFRALLASALGIISIGVALRLVAPRRPGRDADIPRDVTFPKQTPFRLLVADVDGTVAGPDQRISERVRAAVSKARARGVVVALCTGRSPAAARSFVDALDLTGSQIFFDGALVAELERSDSYCCPADARALRKLVLRCQSEGLVVELYTRTHHFVARDTPETDWHGRVQDVVAEVADLEAVLASQTVIKAEIVSRGEASRQVIERLAAEFQGELRFSWAKVPGYPEYDLVNVVHPSVSKGQALTHLASALRIPLDEVFAAGDGANDIPLLKLAGFSVAMGDAPETAKAAANVVVGTVAEDGLAQAIERYVLADGCHATK